MDLRTVVIARASQDNAGIVAAINGRVAVARTQNAQLLEEIAG